MSWIIMFQVQCLGCNQSDGHVRMACVGWSICNVLEGRVGK